MPAFVRDQGLVRSRISAVPIPQTSRSERVDHPGRNDANGSRSSQPPAQDARGASGPWYSQQVSYVRQEPDLRALGAEALTHVDALYAFAWRLAGDKALAEDLVQETFARGLAGGAGFKPGGNLKAWLFRILRNAFLDLKRRDGRSPIRALSEGYDVESGADRGCEPEQLRHLQAQELDAALASLSEEHRSVVLLEVEGFSEHEIAEVMNCAAGTVKSRLSRARAALRSRLQEYAR